MLVAIFDAVFSILCKLSFAGRIGSASDFIRHVVGRTPFPASAVSNASVG